MVSSRSDSLLAVAARGWYMGAYFADYDNDHDGFVDALTVIHSGRGYEETGPLGGDAIEAIQREVRLTRQRKPVVVSMGSVAASGGYWIATYSDRIFAEPTTITGATACSTTFSNWRTLPGQLARISSSMASGAKPLISLR